MFLGHYATGLAAKELTPRTPLPLLLLASQFIDHLWPIFLLLGIERVEIVPGITAATPLDFVHYPWTHSLLMSVIWGVLFGGVVYAFREQMREAVILGLLVPGHWMLDLLTHRPDLLLMPGGGGAYGWGLWNSVPWTLAVELSMFAGGVALYVSSGALTTKRSHIMFWSLIAFLFVSHMANVFGPPPPSVEMIAWAGNSLWIVILWAWGVERKEKGDRS